MGIHDMILLHWVSRLRTQAGKLHEEASEAAPDLRAIQILPGHPKIENTVRYLGVDIEDALELAEHTEIKTASLLAKPFVFDQRCVAMSVVQQLWPWPES